MIPVNVIKTEFENASIEDYGELIERYCSDERAGVGKLILGAKKRILAYETEKARIFELSAYEREYAGRGYVCGIDEVGRGPLAGPVVAAAVILDPEKPILRINDSKKLSAKVREELDKEIREKCIAFGIGQASPERIDEINILNATYEAMRMAIKNLSVKPDILLNDAVRIPEVDIEQVPIIKGDAKSVSIGAASVIAKVYRDRLMKEYDAVYPGYGFASHVGYGTKEHINAIREKGLCDIHRRSFTKSMI